MSRNRTQCNLSITKDQAIACLTPGQFDRLISTGSTEVNPGYVFTFKVSGRYSFVITDDVVNADLVPMAIRGQVLHDVGVCALLEAPDAEACEQAACREIRRRLLATAPQAMIAVA
jgi:hypothetical protein